MNNENSIKNQIRENAHILNVMEVVGNAKVPRIDTSNPEWKSNIKKELFSFYKKLGNTVTRSDIGDIVINERQLSNALRYIDTEGEAAAFYVAVVVKSADKNRYKAHRILTPDGNLFSLDKNIASTKGKGSR